MHTSYTSLPIIRAQVIMLISYHKASVTKEKNVTMWYAFSTVFLSNAAGWFCLFY